MSRFTHQIVIDQRNAFLSRMGGDCLENIEDIRGAVTLIDRFFFLRLCLDGLSDWKRFFGFRPNESDLQFTLQGLVRIFGTRAFLIL